MDLLQSIKNRLTICCNSVGKHIWKNPEVKSIDETLDYILEKKCSVSRYGDGEFAVIIGNSNGFQTINDELGSRLKLVLQNEIDNHIVCLPDIFESLDGLRPESVLFNRQVLGMERRKWLDVIPSDRIYYNTFFTRCYNMFVDKTPCKRWFDKNKQIWDGTDILLIEGKYSRLGVGNDLFANAKSVQRILCPAQNAFDRYDDIYQAAIHHGERKLILLALGMTATVLAYDLAKVGLWAIDIGHIDIEYEWYLRGAKTKIAIPGKYVNEVREGKNVSDDVPDSYLKEVIMRIEKA